MFISHKHTDDDDFPNLEIVSEDETMQRKPKGHVFFPEEVSSQANMLTPWLTTTRMWKH
jgi:hypothetical protein